MVRLKYAIGERAKSTIIYDYFERVDTKFNALNNLYATVRKQFDDEQLKGHSSFNILEKFIQEVNENTNLAINKVNIYINKCNIFHTYKYTCINIYIMYLCLYYISIILIKLI